MSTTGIELKTKRRRLAEAVELVSSMRFAISLLTIIAIAAMIGTVMKQNEPMPNYVNQFGPFWFSVFDKLGLYAVYSAWWFLLILAFLLLSTGLCIVRTTPKMMKDMRSWRENVREISLRNFHHKAEWVAPLSRAALAQQSAQRLADAGYGTQHRREAERHAGDRQEGRRHPLRLHLRALGHHHHPGGRHARLRPADPLPAMVPRQDAIRRQRPDLRDSRKAPPWPGQPDLPRQHHDPGRQSSDVALIPQANGVLVQELPFTIKLAKFHIEFYSTGMPKLFASDVIVRDHETGKTFPATIKVNEPLIYKGVAVYQSSFEDGGTKLKMTAFPMQGVERNRSR